MSASSGYEYRVRERPLGVSILSFLDWAAGLLMLGIGLLVVLAGASLSVAALGIGVGGMGAVIAAGGVLTCVLGHGLGKLRGWAWWVTIVGAGLGFVQALFHFASSPAAFDVIRASVSAGIGAYLWSNPIRSEFAGRRVQGWETPPGLRAAAGYIGGSVVLYVLIVAMAVGLVIYLLSR